MTEGLKATRLSKAAREFNVGISTIVEFLQKKGFEVDSNPNTKIPPEAYSLLLKEYSSDLSVKKESEKLTLNELARKKESLSLDEDSGEIVEETTEPVSEAIVEEEPVKKPEVKAEKEEKAEEKKKPAEKDEADKIPEEKEEPKKSIGPTVVGKIDLEKLPKKKKATAKKEETKKADPEDKKVDERRLSLLKKIAKKIKKFLKKLKRKKRKKQKKKLLKKLKISQLKSLKKLLKEKPEPDGETKKEEKQEFIKTKFQKLSGPTVVGKIDLPTVEEKKKTQQKKTGSDDEDDRRKRRKRIRKDKERVSLKTPVSDKRGDQKRKKKAADTT